MPRDPLAHGGMLRGGVTVEDGVDGFAGGNLALDSVEEANQLLVAMALHVASIDAPKDLRMIAPFPLVISAACELGTRQSNANGIGLRLYRFNDSVKYAVEPALRVAATSLVKAGIRQPERRDLDARPKCHVLHCMEWHGLAVATHLRKVRHMNLKRLLVSAAVVAISMTAAFAADLPMGSAPPVFTPIPVYDWSGFYVGANAGVGWANGGNVTVFDPVLGAQSINVVSRSGFIGGVQLGSNLQYEAFVFGVEADIQYANIGSSINWGPYGRLGISSGSSGEYFGTARLRAGYAIDRTLLFLTGGLAYGGLNRSPLGGNSTSNVGYALGGGVEYAFTRNWTAKVEALYINLSNGSNRTIAVTNGGLVYPITANAGNGGGLVRVGVNYKF
jgi:outer membrane immunogenic protein